MSCRSGRCPILSEKGFTLGKIRELGLEKRKEGRVLSMMKFVRIGTRKDWMLGVRDGVFVQTE